jgi:hypothetical protein
MGGMHFNHIPNSSEICCRLFKAFFFRGPPLSLVFLCARPPLVHSVTYEKTLLNFHFFIYVFEFICITFIYNIVLFLNICLGTTHCLLEEEKCSANSWHYSQSVHLCNFF